MGYDSLSIAEFQEMEGIFADDFGYFLMGYTREKGEAHQLFIHAIHNGCL